MDHSRLKLAFETRYCKLALRLYRYLLACGFSPEVAEEAVANVFLEYWQALEAGNEWEDSYFFKIARLRAIDLIRQEDRHFRIADCYGEHVEWIDYRDPLDPVTARQMLQVGLAGIPEEDRMLLILRCEEGFSYKELSEMLSIPIDQIGAYLHRAKQKFEQALLREKDLQEFLQAFCIVVPEQKTLLDEFAQLYRSYVQQNNDARKGQGLLQTGPYTAEELEQRLMLRGIKKKIYLYRECWVGLGWKENRQEGES